MLQKIKKEIGDYKDLHGLAVFVFNRLRMYLSIFGISFLVLERLFSIIGIDLGVSESLLKIPTWGLCLGLVLVIGFGLFWMYIDLKFIVPSERRSSTGRDPYIREIHENTKKALERLNNAEPENIRSNSKLQQWEIPKSFAWMVEKELRKERRSR